MDQEELLRAVLKEKRDEISREDGLVFYRVHSGCGKCEIEGAEGKNASPNYQQISAKVALQEDAFLLPNIPPIVHPSIWSIQIELFLVHRHHLELKYAILKGIRRGVKFRHFYEMKTHSSSLSEGFSGEV